MTFRDRRRVARYARLTPYSPRELAYEAERIWACFNCDPLLLLRDAVYVAGHQNISLHRAVRLVMQEDREAWLASIAEP